MQRPILPREGSKGAKPQGPENRQPRHFPLIWPPALIGQELYPWMAKDLKELHKAVREDGPNAPWSQTLLQDIAYNPCVPKDWLILAKANHSSTQYIKWCAHYKEECRVQAEANQASQPAILITYGMLAGTADGYSTGVQQATVPAPYRDHVRQARLAAWGKLDEGPTESPIAGVRQNHNETLPEFIDWVNSINRNY